MSEHKNILVTREEIARAGGVRAAVEEALSLAALRMTPRAMTAYEATGMAQTEEDGADVLVKVEVENEEELREAMAAGAGAVLLVKMKKEEARRLCELAKKLRAEG
jgi:imidazoleglycerol phosphate dehydratase HisB